MSETDVGLSDLPDGWVWTALEEVIQIIDYRGRTPPYSSEGIPHLRSSNIKNGKIIWNDLKYVTEETYDKYMTRGLPRQGDLLFTTEAPLGEVAFAPNKKFSLAQRIMILRPFEDIIKPEFLLYQIQAGSFQERLRISETGSVVKGISSRNFKPFPIIIPPLPEQHRIVAKIEELFTKLDAGVNELHKAQSQLKRYRQSVLKAAFEGKLTEAWRTEHQGKIGPAASIVGDLPDGWVWTTLEEVSELNPRIDKHGIDDNLEVTFLPMKNVEELSGKIDLSETKRFSELKRKSYTPFRDGDILFAKVTPCMENGKITIAHDLKNGIGFGSTEFHVIRLSEEQSKQFFFFCFLQQKFRQEAKRAMTSGVGLLRVPTDYMRKVPIPLPPLHEQQAIVSEVESRLSVADKVEKTVTAELKRAEQLRQSILKKAFSGKLVPQDPNDEPASVLLERIKAEKSQHTQGQLRLKFV